MSILTNPSPSYTEENLLKKELNTFSELFVLLRDALINRVFDLRPEAATARLQYLIFLFLLSGFLVSLFYYPLNLWAAHLQDIFLYLFNPAFAANYSGNPFSNFISFLAQVFLDPRILQYLPIFLAPFFIALQTAANYLADIFELEDVGVARQFVTAVALTGSNETIRISKGEIHEEHKDSPTFQIGGPGKVIVDIDSVALFEEPDGTTRVIGPTGKAPGGKAQLDGFERLRQAIDLRNQFIELRDETGKSSEINGRSLDGIPISATDVSFMFSVYRNGQKSTTENPYPFSPEAVEDLIYKATSKVTPNLANPSTFEFSWVNNMVSLVRSRLGGFMNNHRLTEYLANIGQPEIDRINNQKNEIAEEEKELAPNSTEEAQSGKLQNEKENNTKSQLDFTPRYKLMKLFSQFAEEFSKSQYDRGVELHWIGIGTWKTPIEVVPENHMEAWKLSHENLNNGSDASADRWRNEATLQQMMSLIQDVPIGAYQKATEQQSEHTKIMRSVLLDYQKLLISAKEFILAKGEAVPKEIQDAINNINRAFGHVITPE